MSKYKPNKPRGKDKPKSIQCFYCRSYNTTSTFNLDPEKPIVFLCRNCNRIIRLNT